MRSRLWLALLWLATPACPQAIQDSRCYLKNGGAVESFFVSEDTPVGSIIGTLSVNGDPSPGGDISLKLQEKQAAVGVVPGSRNISLLRELDREEKRGPSSVYVNVRCDRLPATAPSFIVPVSIRVWDVNDNAPAWAGGGRYRARVSELSAAGARLPVSARATDADQPGPHATVHYSVLPGPNSEYITFANELDPVLTIKKPLDYETIHNLTVTLRAQDQGSPPLYNDTTLFVEVLDADDQNPKFTYEHYTAVVQDDAPKGTIINTSPGPISAFDQDLGIKAPLFYSLVGDREALLRIDRDRGVLSLEGSMMMPTHTVVVKATQVDNGDRYALATLTLTRNSSVDPPVRFHSKLYSVAVREDTAPGAVLLLLRTDPGNVPGLQFYVSDRSFLDKFAINAAGEVLLRRRLDYETQDQYDYQVMLTDGVVNDTTALNITVINVNEWEPRFRYPQYEFTLDAGEVGASEGKSGQAGEVGAEGGKLPVGVLEVFDGDVGDNVSITLRGTHAHMLEVTPSGGVFLRRAALSALNDSHIHVVATATDTGSPPRQSSVPVSIAVQPRRLQAGSPAGAALAGLLALLAAAIAAAAIVWTLRRRRRSKQSPSPAPGSPGRKPPAAHPPALPPALPAAAAGSTASLRSVSAGASTILSSSSLDLANTSALPPTSRQSQRFSKTKIAPSPPRAPADASGGAAGKGAGGGAGSGAGGGAGGAAWPAAGVPARVPPLAWQTQGSASTEAIHDATNSTLADHMNLTVYF